ncbi:40S ribosomal protein S25 [Penicillium hetheringtonii]|uniref:40S ribosomal protein S25 n=1 Tax=Penicillium hetheringtonii TaxID=911720 RepID=A0AAD6GTX9_9EURO|nr:40S ribosomal protein S25 [Penicillium hetheringtonii]
MAPAGKQKKKWSKGKVRYHHHHHHHQYRHDHHPSDRENDLELFTRTAGHNLPPQERDSESLNDRIKDKAQHAVVFEKSTLEKLNKDVQSYRLVTVATLVDRLKINGSLARKALADLEEKGQIKKVVGHSKMNIYTRVAAAE